MHVRCDYCGPLGWTISEYGQVTHTHSCPYRTDDFCQAHRLGCEKYLPVVSASSVGTE